MIDKSIAIVAIVVLVVAFIIGSGFICYTCLVIAKISDDGEPEDN